MSDETPSAIFCYLNFDHAVINIQQISLWEAAKKLIFFIGQATKRGGGKGLATKKKNNFF